MFFDEPSRPITLMEICGTHTMSIAKAGIKHLLPEKVRLISGPGCPVCVTPSGMIDTCIELLKDEHVIVCSYGDMLRVPGSTHDRLIDHPRVKICLSCMDAIQIAKENPASEVVFLAVGFETTAAPAAILIQEACQQNISNLSILSALKRTEPAIRALLEEPDSVIDGFLCPGHVAAIIGEDGFSFLKNEYQKPGVISGFEPEDILHSLQILIRHIENDDPDLQNTYTRVVRKEGNLPAIRALQDVFEPTDTLWRGLGPLKNSGYKLREPYRHLDAAERFDLVPFLHAEPAQCRCAAILTGKCAPKDCPLFRIACTPQHPVGPCMVSSEGSCAAAYFYEEDEA